MGERSTYVSVVLTVLAVAACLGIYFLIDNQDLVKRQHDKTQKALEELTLEVRQLRRAVETRPVVVAGTGEGSEASPAAPSAFANAERYDPDAEEGGRRVSRVMSFSGNMNYIVNNEATVGTLWETCLDAPAERNLEEVLRFEPVLARSWEVSEDGLVYTIHLREGATWHPYRDPVTNEDTGPKEVTADDFIFYWETVQNADLPCDPIRSYYKLIDRLEKVDRYTYKVIWSEPYSLAESITLGMQPLPKHYYRPDPSWDDKEFAKQMISSRRNHFLVGCGPYRFAEWVKGKEIRLERYEGYYGPKPPIKTLILREIKDAEIALVEFEKGNLDILGLTPEQWTKQTAPPKYFLVTPDAKTAIADSAAYAKRETAGEVSAEYTYEKYQYPSWSWAYIGYNMRKPLFRDRRVRQALTHCVNRPRIVKEVMHDLATVLTGPFVPQSPYYDHSVEPYPFDIEKAKALLAEAGWSDTDGDGWVDKEIADESGTVARRPFAFDFIIPSSSVLIRKWATIAQQDMGKAGIRVNLKPLEWSVYTEVLDEFSYDVCSLLWSGSIESDPYQIWHSSQGKVKAGSNHVGYDSPEADALIEKGRRTLDIDERVKIYQKFHRLLHEDQPYTFLMGFTSTVAVHRRYRNLRVFTTGLAPRFSWVPRAEQVRSPGQ